MCGLEIYKGVWMISSLMHGKRGLIMGVANERSIGWGIAEQLHQHGAELAFSYQGEVLLKRVAPLAERVASKYLLECDVTSEESVKALFDNLQSKWGKIDFIVHSIAFANKSTFEQPYYDTSRADFLTSMDISCFSFVNVCKYAVPLMNDGGSILTMTYYGAEKAIPNYNLMGVAKAALEASVRYLALDLGEQNIRVNAISAGPIKTLAAAGISDFRLMLRWNEENAPLRRNVTIQDVGKAGVYMLSDLSSGVTGEIHYVDSGYNITGMKTSIKQDLADA